MEEKNTEKRKYPRVSANIPVKYRKLGGAAGALGTGTIIKNLSEGGVRFKTNEFISMACRLVLEMDVPPLTSPVKAISKVAWIRKAPAGSDFEIGNQFLEMSRSDKKIVSDYINNLTSTNTSN